MNQRQLYRMRAPGSGREALAHAEPGTVYADRETEEEMVPVAAVLPLLRPADRDRRQRLPLLRPAPSGALSAQGFLTTVAV